MMTVMLGGCSNAGVDNIAQAMDACNRGARYVEVRDSGVVTRVLGERESESGLHEGFTVALRGTRVRVEDNVDITGPIPLRRGERITLQGQFECNDGVIHWTHHDPRGRHIAGYITVDGRTYQ
jgi:hypothetical protein